MNAMYRFVKTTLYYIIYNDKLYNIVFDMYNLITFKIDYKIYYFFKSNED